MNAKILALALLAAAPLAAGAADRKDAELAMTQAATAIQSAQQADASQYASADFGTAQDNLMAAHSAYDARHFEESIIDSENARADANLSAARSRQVRAEATTSELERTVRSLREQIGAPITGGQP